MYSTDKSKCVENGPNRRATAANGFLLGQIFVFSRYDYALDTSEQKVGQTHDSLLAGAVRTRSENGRGRPRQIREGKQGEAHPGNSAPRGGPQLEVSRRWPKTWSELDPSFALVQPLNNPPRLIWHSNSHIPRVPRYGGRMYTKQ